MIVPTIYAMLACKSSNRYTQLAVESFIKNTNLKKDDKFYIIDNDGIGIEFSNVEVIHNTIPQSFAKNSNDIINIANGRNVVILSNDVVFTFNWNKYFDYYNNIIIVPSCNQTQSYSCDKLVLQPSMSIDDFDNNCEILNNFANYHTTNNNCAFTDSRVISYYVFRLTEKIYSKIGLLDESFGIGGGEDVDYRVRGILNGIPTKYFNQSYLLHFGGKSTWDGQESISEINNRNKQYESQFINKWGVDLANLCLSNGNSQLVIEKYQLEKIATENNFTQIIKNVFSASNNK